MDENNIIIVLSKFAPFSFRAALLRQGCHRRAQPSSHNYRDLQTSLSQQCTLYYSNLFVDAFNSLFLISKPIVQTK